jgi:hypothetical protein
MQNMFWSTSRSVFETNRYFPGYGNDDELCIFFVVRETENVVVGNTDPIGVEPG